MLDRDVAELASALFIAIGLGFAFACAYLVRRQGPRTLRVWVGAALVAVPGLLVGVVASHSDLGARAAYRNLTAVLKDPLIIEAEIVIPPPRVGTPDSKAQDDASGTPGHSPSAGPTDGESDGGSIDESPIPSPAPTVDPPTPPPSPSPTPPPSPSETPPPSPTEPPPAPETSPTAVLDP